MTEIIPMDRRESALAEQTLIGLAQLAKLEGTLLEPNGEQPTNKTNAN